jgi:hypothetical protein
MDFMILHRVHRVASQVHHERTLPGLLSLLLVKMNLPRHTFMQTMALA